MRIAVLTIWADNYDELAAVTVPVMQTYCDRHGYTLFPIKINKLDDNSYGFRKVIESLKVLKDFHVVMSIDVDCLITNQNIKIESFIGYGKYFFITSDINGINSGVFISRGSWGISFLELVLMCGKNYDNEQNAISELLKNDIFKTCFEIVPQPCFNSYPYIEYAPTYGKINGIQETIPTHKEGNWEEGDFLMHVPGLPLKTRIEILKNIKIT